MPLPKSIEDELREYLRHSQELDLGRTLERICEDQRKFFERLVAHDAEDKERHAELRGDLKGLSLRVGSLEKSDSKLEKDLDDSKRWRIELAEGKGRETSEQLQWIRRNWLPTVMLIVTWLTSTGIAVFELVRK